jgi:hypothetical protein
MPTNLLKVEDMGSIPISVLAKAGTFTAPWKQKINNNKIQGGKKHKCLTWRKPHTHPENQKTKINTKNKIQGKKHRRMSVLAVNKKKIKNATWLSWPKPAHSQHPADSTGGREGERKRGRKGETGRGRGGERGEGEGERAWL